MSSFFVKRPKRGEDDDDLLRFQEEFLRDLKPSAQVIRVSKQDKPLANTPNKDSFNQQEHTPDNKDATTMDIEMDSSCGVDVLSHDILERKNVEAFANSFPVEEKQPTPAGFPVVPKLTAEDLTAAKSYQNQPAVSKRKKSLFLQQMEASRGKRNPTKPKDKQLNQQSARSSPAAIDSISDIKREISKENEDKLANMSAEEIHAEQQELMSRLDPKIIAMLKCKGTSSRGRSCEPQVRPPSEQQPPHQCNVDLSEPMNRKENKDIIKPITASDLPFPVDKTWMNMDKLEAEKLKWLKPLDEQKQSKRKSVEKMSARFDFYGNLIDPEKEVSTTDGLHHHGDEPGQAGYTLEELFVLVRSLNMSQKVLALSTLANIMRKARAGDYQQLLNTSLMKPLLDADIVMLLRYALDEKSDLVLAAAVNAWHALLTDQSDQGYLYEVRSTLHGHILPELSAHDTAVPETDEEIAEREEEQYVEVLKRDVVGGLLLMEFLPRLRYILEVVHPQQNTCVQILEILSRLALTSKQVAYQISRAPRMLQVVFAKFLPESLGNLPTKDMLNSATVSSCLRFLQMLLSSGRNMAATLSVKWKLVDILVESILGHYQGITDILDDMATVECIYSLRILVLYGLGLNTFHLLYQTLVRKLHREENNELKTAIVCLFTAYLSAAGSAFDTSLSGSKKTKSVHFSEMNEGRDQDVRERLEWTHVSGSLDTVYSLMTNQFNLLVTHLTLEPDRIYLPLLSASLDFVSVYLTAARYQSLQTECMVTPMKISADFTQGFTACMLSPAFKSLLSSVRRNSILLHNEGFLMSESTPNLPLLNSVVKKPLPVEDQQLISSHSHERITLQYISVFHSMIRLMDSLLKVEPQSFQKLMTDCLLHNEVYTYIQCICSRTSTASSINYFSYVETDLIIDLAIMAAHVPAVPNSQTIHKMSLTVVPMVTNRLLYKLEQLFVKTVFNTELFRKWMKQAETIDKCLQDCLPCIHSISNTYISMLLPLGETFNQSRAQYNRQVHDVTSFFTSIQDGALLPSDWPFLPIIHLFQKSQSSKVRMQLPPDTAHIARNCLQLIYLIETIIPSLHKCIELNARITRIMCCFLLDNDLFLEGGIQALLQALLSLYTARITHIDFSKPVPGLNSFKDLYGSLVEQFEAASFGDNVFAQYILLPMTQSQDLKYRKLVWCENPIVLRSIFLNHKDLLFPVRVLLDPEETESSVIMMMARSLLDGTLKEKRNPLMYLIAVHHVNRFMYRDDSKDTELRNKLLHTAKHCTAEPLGLHLTHYKDFHEVNGSEITGIVCYDKLPASRCLKLSQCS